MICLSTGIISLGYDLLLEVKAGDLNLQNALSRETALII